MLKAEKKHLMQENAPEKKIMMNEGVEKIILATLNSPKTLPPVEGLNVINNPKCNKSPKCNNILS